MEGLATERLIPCLLILVNCIVRLKCFCSARQDKAPSLRTDEIWYVQHTSPDAVKKSKSFLYIYGRHAQFIPVATEWRWTQYLRYAIVFALTTNQWQMTRFERKKKLLQMSVKHRLSLYIYPLLHFPGLSCSSIFLV